MSAFSKINDVLIDVYLTFVFVKIVWLRLKKGETVVLLPFLKNMFFFVNWTSWQFDSILWHSPKA